MGFIFTLLSGFSLRFWLYVAASFGFAFLVAGAYVKGRMDCSNAVEIAQLEADIAALKAANASLQRDAEQARVDADTLADLEGIINETLAHIADGDCFSADESDRLRKLWTNR